MGDFTHRELQVRAVEPRFVHEYWAEGPIRARFLQWPEAIVRTHLARTHEISGKITTRETKVGEIRAVDLTSACLARTFRF